ncbi:hypothetical protein G6R29_05225 [Fructobacillus sp. M2-14]|uniref:Uncharacterized protein n=1 Tax=Fructobacillus broussonetiae TaxID=2713173 RepID=A0ABS5R0Q3_9LACO|nr:hypothetical protein [Fructobacillus broussonetiae]MBS9339021.1 hypothetical protein [Fructobacillus broussonetiae]
MNKEQQLLCHLIYEGKISIKDIDLPLRLENVDYYLMAERAIFDKKLGVESALKFLKIIADDYQMKFEEEPFLNDPLDNLICWTCEDVEKLYEKKSEAVSDIVHELEGIPSGTYELLPIEYKEFYQCLKSNKKV